MKLRRGVAFVLLPALAGWLIGQFAGDGPLGVVSPSGAGRYEKYPALARDPNGDLWLARTSYESGRDEILVSRFRDGAWTQGQRIDEGQGVEGAAKLLLDRDGALWVFWHGRRSGRWSVFARRNGGAGWERETRLSDPSIDCLHPTAVVDNRGRIWLAWEAGTPGGFQIETGWLDKGLFTSGATIFSSGLDRRPWLESCPDGRVFLAWDSTRSHNYDIWLAEATATGPGFGAPRQVTADASIDDSPSLACTSDGSLWLAWNAMRSKKSEPLRADRHSGEAFVRVLREGRWLAPPGPAPGLSPGQVSHGAVVKTARDAVDPYWHWKQTQNYPRVFRDGRDRCWIIWRTDATGAHNFDLWGRVHDGKSWSPELHLTDFSPGRDEWPTAATIPDSTLWLAWEGQTLPDQENAARLSGGDVDLYNTLGNPNVALVGRLSPLPAEGWRNAPLESAPEEVFRKVDLNEPIVPGPPPGGADTSDGRWKIFFGDPHMHSVLSDGKTGLPDQLLALARDHLGLDFAVVSDHAEMGILQASEFAELQLTAKLFDEPGRFVSLTGWEWTAGSRYGHRVVLQEDEGGPPLSWARPDGDSIEALYAHLRQHGGIVSPHHTGNATWGRWNPEAAHDEQLEPNFEIASWHGRFEFYGNPREGRRQVPGHQYQDALRRGRHVGVMAASDTHHLSPGEGGLTAILAERLDRESLFEALQARRNYATSGPRIVLEFTANGQPMGSRIQAQGSVRMSVRVEGTAPVDRVEIVRNLIDTFAAVRLEQDPAGSEGVYMVYEPRDPQAGSIIKVPDTRRLSFSVVDEDEFSGETSYYVRVTQTDGHQAWASPIWVSR